MNFKKNPTTDFVPVNKLDRHQAREEAVSLREGIHYHDYLYYVKNQPEISDALYDRLFHRLQELEEAFPELQTEDSPTRRVGSLPVDKLKKVKHAAPMLSLNAALEEKDVREFDRFIRENTGIKSPAYVVEPKFDGFSVEVVYREGRMEYGATRGDGIQGEDISENLKTVRELPLILCKDYNIPSFLAVRGEVYMRKDGFQQLNKERIQKGKDPFANPRNAAAGAMRQLDSRKVAKLPLEIVFYEILLMKGADFQSHWEALKQLSKWGLKTTSHNKRCEPWDDIADFHNELAEKRDTLDYEIDGIVIKLDDYGLRESLGTRERSPRWAFAWKFPPREDVTILQEIVVQVGRTGILTPVALLRPVDVGGVTISRATLHNESEVKRKDIRAGDKVRVARAGDVIPEVVERIKEPGKKRGDPFSMPRTCPACGTEVVREGAYVLCPAGLSCPPQIVGQVMHFASRESMDIDGLGEKTVKQLVEKGMVKDIAGLYRLSEKDLLSLDGFAKKSAHQLYEAIQGTKNPSLDRFIYALGIRHVGAHAARLLAGHFRDLENLQTASIEELQRIPEVGLEMAASIRAFFDRKQNQDVLKRLKRIGIKVKEEVRTRGKSPLKGKTFVFTGSLSHFTRDEAKREIERLGARATSSVSGNTDYLVVGEEPGSKLEEAEKEKVTILRENDFQELLEKS